MLSLLAAAAPRDVGRPGVADSTRVHRAAPRTAPRPVREHDDVAADDAGTVDEVRALRRGERVNGMGIWVIRGSTSSVSHTQA